MIASSSRMALVATLLACGFMQPAVAEEYPAKPIRLVVPYPAGGITDALARSYAKAISDELRQAVVVENKGGAGGNLGMDAVAKSKPDGYTLGFGTIGPLAINASLFKKLPYDPKRDFQPIALLASTPNIIAANPASPYTTLQDVIRAAKTSSVDYATGGNGTSQHLASEMLDSMLGLKMTHIPFNGEGPALTAVIGGQVPLLQLSFSAVYGQVKAGRLVGLAVTSSKRSPLLPNVPTVAEAAGLPDFEASPWFGVVAPAGLSKALTERLNAASLKALGSKDFTERISTAGGTIRGSSPEQFGEFIRKEVDRWAVIVHKTGATVD
ncbi:MAG: Bug family tripartite tricarboxylate transporter substrate binding protein [Cupriavidus necator]